MMMPNYFKGSPACHRMIRLSKMKKVTSFKDSLDKSLKSQYHTSDHRIMNTAAYGPSEEMFMIKRKVDAQYLKASQEHTIVYEYLDTLRSRINDEHAEAGLPQLKETLHAFEKAIQDHFELEEQALFPAALTCLPDLDVIDTVLCLQKEHGHLERDLDNILTLLQNQPSDKIAIPPKLIDNLKKYIELMDTHAHEEIDLLFNKMDQPKACQKLIKGLIIPI